MHPKLGRIAPDEVSNRVQHRERVKHPVWLKGNKQVTVT